jgi:hypothetical protein
MANINGADAYGPDFNSSDIEFETPVDEFASAGRQSIADMLAHPEDRIYSKMISKQLQQGGSWSERYMSALWLKRLAAFRQSIQKE